MQGLFFELRHACFVIFDIYVVGLGEQATWDGKSLHLGPFFVSILGTLQGNNIRVLRGGIIQPIQRVAYILSMTIACTLLFTELVKGLSCVSVYDTSD